MTYRLAIRSCGTHPYSKEEAKIMAAILGLIAWSIFYSLPLYIIAQKSGHEYAWVAFVPIADFWLMCDLADVNILIGVLYLVPYLNVLVHMYLWSRLAENTNKSPLWGVLMVVPIVNIFVSFYLALYEPNNTRY
jgi:hypothetical protein